MIVLMGVSGAGKTTVGQLLASELRCEFADADDYHSAANVAKMRRGIPLADADRQPWLETLRDRIATWTAEHQTVVLACSALKQSYRGFLQISADVRIVYLKVDVSLLRERLRRRTGHFMTEAMLDSQLTTLEEPKDAMVVGGDISPGEIVRKILDRLPAS